MEFELLRIIATLSFLTAATYYDLFNKKNVPVFIPYAMISIGLLLNIFTLNLNFILSSSAVALAVLAIGYLVYRTGQLGGADVLIFAGISLLLPNAPSLSIFQASAQQPLFTYPFILSVFLVSGFLAVIGLSAKYVPKVACALLRGNVEIKAQSALSSVLIVASYLAVIYFFSEAGILSTAQSVFLLLLVLLAGFLTLFKDYISSSMVEWVPLGSIDEEDVIALHLLDEKLVRRLKLQPVLTPSEMVKLKRTRMKKFPIFKGMPPFLPYVLVALIFLLLFGDPLTLMFT